MTQGRGAGFAVVLAIAFVLWLPVAVFGSQGYSALIGLTAIAAAFFAPLRRFNLIVVSLFALAIWSAASSLWSAETGTIINGALSEGTMNVDAAGLRILLTVLASTLTIAAALRIPYGAGRKSLLVVGCMLGLHGLVTVLMGLLPELTLDLYSPMSDRVKEAPQNILRSANAFVLGLPILIGLAAAFAGRATVAACVALLTVAFVAFLMIGTDVALLGVICMAVAIGVVLIFVHHGFRVLMIAISAFIFLSPLILGVGAAALTRTDMPMPCSVQSRVWAWNLTSEKIQERPITGHGIEASKEWRDTFGDRPELLREVDQKCRTDNADWEVYRILPGHPHNMGLQIWAETGIIGVILAIASLIIIGNRLPRPGDVDIPTRIAIASLIGGSFALFSLSYSVWNEAFWATIALASAGVILLDRVTGPARLDTK